MSWKSPVCASEPTVAQQWLWCQPSPLGPAEVVGQQGPLPIPAQGRARRVTQGPALCTGSSEEQRDHAQEVAAESRAEQE